MVSLPESIGELTTLAPEALVERLRSLAQDLQLAYAPNTLRTWGADWRVWIAHCRAHGCAVLPADLGVLRAFLSERIAAGRKRATLDHYLSTLALVHRLAGAAWVLDTMDGKLLWRGLRRSLKSRQRQVQGLTLADIEQLLAPLSLDRAIDVRDAALLTLAYETMCRRSELISLQVEQFSVEADGSGRVLLERSKTDQEAEGAVLFVSVDTMQRVQRWIAMAGITEGALLRSVPRSNRVDRFDTVLSDRDVARIFKRRALAVGLDPARISGHSTRVGAAQDLLAANFSGAQVMRQGRWKSERMVIRYGEHIEAGRGAMAQWLRRKDKGAG